MDSARHSSGHGHAAATAEIAGLFYDAALDPPRWRDALSALAAGLGGNAAAIDAGPAGAAPFITASAGIDPAAVDAYRAHYGALDPMVGAVAARGVGWERPVASHDVMPGGIERTEFHADWALPNGFDDYLCLSLLPAGAAHYATIGVARPLGAPRFEHEERSALVRLAPHLRRAVEVHRRLLGTAALPAGPLADALDRFAAGIVLADARGMMVWANRAALALLAAADGVALGRRSTLVAADPGTTAALLRLVAATAAGSGGALALPRPSAQPPLAVLAVPLSDRLLAERLAPLPVVPWPRALLLLLDPTREAAAPGVLERRLQALYGLTAAEAKVAARAARGEGLPAVAQALGVAPTTARTLAQRAFGKVGVRGQADLARLVAHLDAVGPGGRGG
jgi:DNA-binding CsgD family transcriptional regulator